MSYDDETGLSQDTMAMMEARYIADEVRRGSLARTRKAVVSLAEGFAICDRQRAALHAEVRALRGEIATLATLAILNRLGGAL